MSELVSKVAVKYITKPNPVEAIRWSGHSKSTDAVLDFSDGNAQVGKRTMSRATPGKWKIHTLHVYTSPAKWAEVKPGDYIVRDLFGRYHVFTETEFNELFEEYND